MSKQTKFGGDAEIKMVEKMSLEAAESIAGIVVSLVDTWCEKIEVVGSIRRKKPEVGDIDFVVLPSNWKSLKDTMITMAGVKVVISGESIFRTLMLLEGGEWVQVDFYRAKPETYGIHKLIRTGSAEHNIWLAKFAIKQDLRLQYSRGVVEGNTAIAGLDETEVFHALNLEFIPPELREIGSDRKPIWDAKKYWRYGWR